MRLSAAGRRRDGGGSCARCAKCRSRRQVASPRSRGAAGAAAGPGRARGGRPRCSLGTPPGCKVWWGPRSGGAGQPGVRAGPPPQPHPQPGMQGGGWCVCVCPRVVPCRPSPPPPPRPQRRGEPRCMWRRPPAFQVGGREREKGAGRQSASPSQILTSGTQF